jgi:hypothetical protein
LFGKNDRRFACAVVAVFVAAAFAFPTFASAESGEDGAVVEYLAPPPFPWWIYWSRQRLEDAEPLPIITLPETAEAAAEPEASPMEAEASTLAEPEAFAPSDSEASSGPSEGGSTATLAGRAAARTAAIEGVEVAAAESTSFPNSANGKLFGTFRYRVGPNEFKREDYVCSASVVNAPENAEHKRPPSNAVVTAGHCAIDPETGAETTNEMIFIPGYHEGEAPFGVWQIEFYATPEAWKKTAKEGVRPNEGADIAFIGLKSNSAGERVGKVVGALGIDFDQACDQTYTQFGYPAEAPYGGELLYSHTTGYAGADTEGAFTPVPMKIASDFTRGASGGPWTVGIGSGTPTVLSLTAYGYANQPGYLFGPYFGEAAKKAYGTAFGKILPAGIEETCAPLPPLPPQTPPVTNPPAPSPQPPESSTPPAKPVTLRVTRVRRLANGSAVLTAKVSTAGSLKLSGAAVRAESLYPRAAGQYRMVVAPKGPTNRKLRQVGKAKVGVKVAFSASGKTKRVSKKIALKRASVAGTAQRRSGRGG